MGKKRPAAASREEPAKKPKHNGKSRDQSDKGNKKKEQKTSLVCDLYLRNI
jgi:hypothetical protein